MSKSAKNELLEKLLAKRKNRGEEEKGAYEGQVTPFQQSVFLAALSDVDHRDYLLHLLLSLATPLPRQDVTELLGKLFSASPALCLCVVEKESGYVLEHRPFSEANVSFEHFVSVNEIEGGVEDLRIPVTDPSLFKITCFESSSGVQFIRFTFHHLLIDGAGVEVLRRRIVSLIAREDLTLDQRYEGFALECTQMEASFRKKALEVASKLEASDFTQIPPGEGQGLPEERLFEIETAGLDDFCKARQITRPGLLYGCLALTLSAVTRSAKINLGTVAENRGAKDADALGCFINTTLLSYDFADVDGFDKLIDAAKASVLSMLEMSDVPYVYVREEIQRAGRTKGQIFQVFVNYMADTGAGKSNLTCDLSLIPARNLKFDLNFLFREEKNKLLLLVDGKLDFSQEWLNALFQSFLRVLTLCLTGDKKTLLRPDLFFKPTFNPGLKTERKLLLRQFEESAQLTPDRAFILCSHVSLSYGEAAAFAQNVCRALVNRNLPRGGRVGIILDRSAFFIPTCMGIWMAGGSYVPIDVRQNSQRKADIIRYGSLFCTLALDPDADLPTPDLDIQELIESTGPVTPSRDISSEDEAYVLFTSGSTGTPKGVSVGHGNIAHYTASLSDYLEAETLSGLTFGVVSTPAADLGNTSIFLAIGNSGAIAQFGYEEVLQPEVFQNLIEKFGVDVLKIVPSHFQGLYATLQGAHLPRRMIIFGGEKLSGDLVRQLRSRNSDLRICNHYGPTETTVGVFCSEIKEIPEKGFIPLGKPFGETQVAVLDHQKRFLHPALRGELVAYGPSVARGYINGTSNTFGTDEFGSFYQTGDLVQSIRGSMVYLEREDDQLKINGVRLDLSELDQAVRKVCEISKFHILYLRSSFHVFHTEKLPSPVAQIIEELSKIINVFLVPAGFIRMDKIPVGPNGKVDKQKLIYIFDEQYREKKVELSSDLHPKVLNAWQLSFGTPNSVLDSVFQSGGSSLVAARMLSRLNREFQATVSLGHFLKAPTLLHLNQLFYGGNQKSRMSSELSQNELSSFQKRMWFINRLNPKDPSYNVPLFLHLKGDINQGSLEEFLRQIFTHFLILQTRFKEVSGEVEIFLDDGFSTAYSHADDSSIQSQFSKLHSEGIDLLTERPFRVFHAAGSLLISFHHIITDGISNKFFLELLDTFLKTGVADLTRYPRLLTQSSLAKDPAAENFWEKKLQNFTPLDFTLQKSTSELEPCLKELILNWAGKQRVETWCKGRGVFPKDYFLGLLTICLSYAFNAPRFYQLTAINTRNDEDDYQTLGAALDTMLFGFEVRPEESFDHFVQRVKDTFWEFHQRTDISFGQQLQALKLLDREGKLIPNYMFAFEKGSESYENFSCERSPKLEAKFPLSITVFEHDDHFRIELSSRSQEVSGTSLEQILKILTNLLEQTLTSPGVPIVDLEFHKGLEVCRYEGLACEIPSLLEEFTRQVNLNSGKVCAEDEDSTLTFAEVNEASDKLACHLHHSYGTGKIIGIHLQRSTRLLVTILGVLKSGNAFSPIDTTTPPLRFRKVTSEVHELIDENVFDELLKKDADERKLPHIDPDSTAYCIFTSGSTGQPKAVPITHRAISNYLSWARDEYLADHMGPIPLISSLNYDLTVTSYLLPLFSGRSCRIFKQENILAALDQFARTSESWSLVKMTPSHLRIIKDQLLKSDVYIHSLVLGGEGLESGLLSDLTHVKTFFNEYGPAETTIGVTIHKFSPAELRSGPCPIGRPVANSSFELTGFLGLPVLPNTRARLFIRGVQVFDGYHGDPRRTHGVYDSGDLAFEEDGRVYYSGRDDRQIKISGNRIELGEMELALRDYFPFMKFQLEVIKYQGHQTVVLVSDVGPDRSMLSDAKKLFLEVHPAYMLPEFFIHKQCLRVLDSGKTDWEATLSSMTSAHSPVPESGDELEKVAALWTRILRLENVDRDLNFFDAGGTSLSLVQLLASLKQICVRNISIVDLLRLTTIRQQSSLLLSSTDESVEAYARTRKKVDMRKRN